MKRLQNGETLSKSIEDVIALDVQRSFAASKVVNPVSVKNVLRAYALHNPKVEYCQGMNFVAGFLHFMMQNEEMTFRSLVCLIEKFHMHDLFAQDVPLLRKYFFQMDRVYYLHYPELSEYLRNEGVSTNYYSSTWFMTLFTNIFNYSKIERPPETLLAIWDEFLFHGWKAVFKTGLYVMAELHNKLLELRFDDIMMLLNELPKAPIFQDPASAPKLRDALAKKTVTSTVVNRLNNEYSDTMEGVRKTLDQVGDVPWASPENSEEYY